MYADDIQDSSIDNHMENVAGNLDHVRTARAFLVSLVSSESYPDCERSLSRKKQLLEEIELFTKCLMEEDDA